MPERWRTVRGEVNLSETPYCVRTCQDVSEGVRSVARRCQSIPVEPNEEPRHLGPRGFAESRNAAVASVATRLLAGAVDPANLATEIFRPVTEREPVAPEPASGAPLKTECVTVRRSKGDPARARPPAHRDGPLLGGLRRRDSLPSRLPDAGLPPRCQPYYTRRTLPPLRPCP